LELLCESEDRRTLYLPPKIVIQRRGREEEREREREEEEEFVCSLDPAL